MVPLTESWGQKPVVRSAPTNVRTAHSVGANYESQWSILAVGVDRRARRLRGWACRSLLMRRRAQQNLLFVKFDPAHLAISFCSRWSADHRSAKIISMNCMISG